MLRSESLSRRTAGLLLLAVLALGIVFRAMGLGALGAFDEAASWYFARLPWDTFWEVMWRFEGNAIAYYLLLRSWLHVGSDLILMRSLSVALGIATIGCLYLLGARLFNRRTGLVAAALLAVHAFHIQYSQEARGYALTSLLLVVSMLLFAMSLQRRTRTTDIAYVAASAVACYGHLLSVLVLGAQWLWFVCTHGLAGLRTRFWTLVGLASTCLPTVWYAVAQNGGQIDWIKPLNRWRFLNQFTNLVGGDRATLVVYGLLGAIAVAFALFAPRHAAGDGNASFRRNTGLAVAWLAVPVATLVLISPVKSMFVDRYLLMCVPAIVLLGGIAIDRMLQSGGAVRVAGTLLGLVTFAVTANAALVQYRGRAAQPDELRNMTNYVLTRQQPGDAVILFTAATYFSFEYYATVAPPANVTDATSVVFPNFGGLPSGLQPNPSPAQIRSAIAGKSRVWVLLNKAAIRLVRGAADTEPLLLRVMDEQHALADTQPMGFIEVRLYTRRNAQTVPATSGS